jgi:hypothetical protein
MSAKIVSPIDLNEGHLIRESGLILAVDQKCCVDSDGGGVSCLLANLDMRAVLSARFYDDYTI